MNGIIQCKLIGRWGNMLHQYAACRAYAEAIGAQLEVEPWCGSAIFQLDDPPWSCELPEVNDGGSSAPVAIAPEQTNVRIGGYFQHQKWIGYMNRWRLKQWFTFRPQWLRLLPKLRRWYVAAHVRRGDYVNHPLYATVSMDSYARAAAGYPAESLVLVSDEAPRLEAGVPPEFSFLPDFMTLVQADVLFRANSTFSWWAAVLSDAKVFAPVVEDRVGECDVEFVEGNWPRCADTTRVGVKVEDLHLAEG